MTDWVAFKELLRDDASEAFRIASEDDRPVRLLKPLPQSAPYRNAGIVARDTVHRAAQRFGVIPVPEVRWFSESIPEWEEQRVHCGGLVIRGYNVIWLNRQLALGADHELQHSVAHEVAHLAGVNSESECDAFAAQFTGHQPSNARCHEGGGEIRWFPSRGAIPVNHWELRNEG